MPTQTITVPFNEICEPGTYICNWSGHLMQVPQNAITSEGVPYINIWGKETPCVTKISDDWNMNIDDARELANNCDCQVNF
ncbi:MAG: hypothetical protein GY715_22270 [Planctomycetes bacterium]|nr:hypothetical protein [Planctomycetota bacterium]